jgi:CRP/FNR family transcriptional regulator, nitrogen fixation regulation protein
MSVWEWGSSPSPSLGAGVMHIQSATSATQQINRKVSAAVRQFGPISVDRGLAVRRVHFAKDQQVFGHGDPATDVYSVVSGAVRTYKLLHDGRCQILAFHLPNDLFGIEFSSSRNVTADALAETEVVVASQRELEQSAIDEPEVAQQLWHLTAEQLNQADDRLLSLGRRRALERIVAFLIEMDDRLGGKEVLSLPMRRSDIGDHLGLTIETVSRALAALHAEGFIVIDPTCTRDIILRDRKRLKSLVDSAIVSGTPGTVAIGKQRRSGL